MDRAQPSSRRALTPGVLLRLSERSGGAAPPTGPAKGPAGGVWRGGGQRWLVVAGMPRGAAAPLLWLLLLSSRGSLDDAARPGNPVNAAAQSGTPARITAATVAAWESLSRCEWAPLCPSLLLSITFSTTASGGGDAHWQAAERLASAFRGRAAFGFVFVPEDGELATKLLGHIPPPDELPLSIVFRRGVVLRHTRGVPQHRYLEEQLGLPSHEHGTPGLDWGDDLNGGGDESQAPPRPDPGRPYTDGARRYTPVAGGAATARSPTAQQSQPGVRRRDPKTGRRSAELPGVTGREKRPAPDAQAFLGRASAAQGSQPPPDAGTPPSVAGGARATAKRGHAAESAESAETAGAPQAYYDKQEL